MCSSLEGKTRAQTESLLRDVLEHFAEGRPTEEALELMIDDRAGSAVLLINGHEYRFRPASTGLDEDEVLLAPPGLEGTQHLTRVLGAVYRVTGGFRRGIPPPVRFTQLGADITRERYLLPGQPLNIAPAGCRLTHRPTGLVGEGDAVYGKLSVMRSYTYAKEHLFDRVFQHRIDVSKRGTK
jgi:hypothetical protein